MRAKLAARLERIWFGGRVPPVGLRILAGIYGLATASRQHRPTAPADMPVIVVGNLTTGGSGKTPVVAELARYLDAQGCSVAIISRGYGGAEPRRPLRLSAQTSVDVSGDEARELFVKTGLPVWVCARRAQALACAREHGADVVISDDGLQHQGLARSFEICLVDGRRGFGNGRLLPAGPLRQPLRRLQSVDLVLVKQAKGPTRAGLPGTKFRLEVTALKPLHDPDAAPPEPPQAIDAVAGIADPQPFFESLEARGFSLRRHQPGDHRSLSSKRLASLSGPVVMTAKDAVRLEGCSRRDLFVLEVRARLPAAVLEQVLEHVREFRP